MTLANRVVLLAVAISVAVAACTSGDGQGLPSPSSVAQADAQAAGATPALRLGLVTNIAAPTAERDARIVELFRSAARTASNEPGSVQIQIEEIRIDDSEDVAGALDALLGLGITAVATTCDDGSVPQLVDAAIEADLLVVASCITIPEIQIETSDPLFFNTAILDDAPAATARWATGLGDGDEPTRVATISSDLVPGVIEVCEEVDDRVDQPNALSTLALSLHFTELIDDVGAVLDEAAGTLEEVDSIVVCALSPTVGEVVAGLRERGHDQPVVVPWFGADEQWGPEISNVHIVAPTSAGGDDPSSAINELYAAIDVPTVLDVAVADSFVVLQTGVELSASASPRRMVDALSESALVEVPGGRFNPSSRVFERDYRVIEITNGNASFTTLVE